MHRHFNKRGVPNLQMIFQTIQPPVPASPEGVRLRAVMFAATVVLAGASESALVHVCDVGRSMRQNLRE